MALGPCKHPPLPNKPGSNWVEKTGGLPKFIDCVARAIYHTGRSQGDVSKAISIAVGKVEDWAAGKGGVKPDTRAQAVAAVAEWNAKRTASKAQTKNLSDEIRDVIDLAFDEAKHPRGHGGKWVHVGAQVRVHMPNWDKPGPLVHTVTAVHGDGTATIKKPDAPSLGGGATQRVRIDHLRPVEGPAATGSSVTTAERRAIAQEEYRKAKANVKPNVPGKRGNGEAGYSGQQIAAIKGIARKRALARIDALEARRSGARKAPQRPLPKRINSPAMVLSDDLRERVTDLTDRLGA